MSILPTNMNIGASSNFLSGNLGASNINNSGDFPTVVTSTNQHGYTLPKSTFNMSGYALNSTWDQKTLRLASFSKWPLTARANPSTLAEAGFYYTGEGAGDTVTCYSCRLKVSNWKDEMVPIVEHKKRCPGCAVVREWELRNGPIPGETNLRPMNMFSDATPQLIPGIPEAAPPMLTVPAAVPYDSSEDMTIEENRLRSFTSKPGWPVDCPVKPHDLSKSGFFYTGDRDKVMCAYCRGRLLNWSPGDSAFGEHMRHFPRCSFLEKLAKEAEERDELSRRTANISINSSDSENSFQHQGNSGFGGQYLLDMWMDTPTVKIVRDLGMQETFIKQALVELANQGITELTSAAVLDIVFRLEDESRIQTEEGVADSDSPMDTSERNPEQNDMPVEETESLSPQPQPPSKHLPDAHPFSQLQLENKRLKKSAMCRECGERVANVLFLPCRHLGSCDRCSSDLHQCKVCKQAILGTVKTFMS